MSCQGTPKFRLLDPYVGWDEDNRGTSLNINIDGLYDEHGLRIKDPHSNDVSREILTPYMPPAWIASDPERHTIYVCGQTKDQKDGLLLRRDPCGIGWIDIRSQLDNGSSVCNPIAVACRGNRLVVVDLREGYVCLLIWSLQDGRLAGRQEISLPVSVNSRRAVTIAPCCAVAIAPWNEVILAVEPESTAKKTRRLHRFDLAGRFRGVVLTEVIDSPIVGFVASRESVLWVASKSETKSADAKFFRLWTVIPEHTIRPSACQQQLVFRFKRISNEELGFEKFLDASLIKTPVRSASDEHLCIADVYCPELNGMECIARSGGSLSEPPAATKLMETISGDFESEAIDSGIPRCHWHRIRLDVELPPSASYEIELATSENNESKPHRYSWQTISESPTDLLIDQPPGRYLYLRIKMQGRPKSPVIHRIRIDFPRVTSLDQLPVIYREDPDAEDFTERFLSLFDAAIEDLDSVIEQLPALLDPEGVPEEVLPWLSNFLGIALDSDWTNDQRRALLRAAPRLYQQRGTRQGMVEALKLLFNLDSEPVIQERAAMRRWGILNHGASLGQFRLFGKSESRFRLGSSAIGSAPLRSFGNPDHDPVQSDAFRFEIYIPPILNTSSDILQRIDQVIGSQKPAHTQHTVRIGGEGFIIGHRSIIGIDTQFEAPPPVVLSDKKSKGLRLGEGVLRPGPNRPTSSLHLDVTFSIGVNTFLE